MNEENLRRMIAWDEKGLLWIRQFRLEDSALEEMRSLLYIRLFVYILYLCQ